MHVELPNGQTVHCLNPEEALFLYQDIFVRHSYLQHRITLHDGDTVFDVGSNIGMFAHFAYQHGGSHIKLFGFEPVPQLFQLLKQNLQSRDAVLYQAGLWDTAGQTQFGYLPHYSLLSGAFAEFSAAEKQALVQLIVDNLHNATSGDMLIGQMLRLCPEALRETLIACLIEHHFLKTEIVKSHLLTLSQVIREHNLTRIDLLKVDAEKAELKILQGIAPADWNKIHQLVVEVHDIQGRLVQICNLLQKQGFELVTEAGAPPKFLAFSLLGLSEPHITQQSDRDLLYTVYAKRSV